MQEDSTMRLSVLGLILTLALAMFVAPLATEAQPPGKIHIPSDLVVDHWTSYQIR